MIRCLNRGWRLLALLMAVLLFCGFSFPFFSDMPFNGDVAFHKIALTIPRSYIRDSTRSSDDFWVFEKGLYSNMIMLSRKDLEGNLNAVLENYISYLSEQGVESVRTDFLEMEAVHSFKLEEEMAWREMLFVHEGSIYAVAMRGGEDAEFEALLDSVSIGAKD